MGWCDSDFCQLTAVDNYLCDQKGTLNGVAYCKHPEKTFKNLMILKEEENL